MINGLVLFLFSYVVWSDVSLDLKIPLPEVKQGEIVHGQLLVKESTGQAALSGLKGKNLGKTLYLLHVGPFMGKQGQLEAEAKFIFIKVPQSNAVSEVINGEQVYISWSDVTVQPTEETKSFLLGDFSVPARKDVKKWFLILFSILVLAFGIHWLFQHFGKKGKSRLAKKKFKNELLSCISYEDVVSLWQRKIAFLIQFPQLEDAFRELESTLFKYQFKPKQDEKEKQDVMTAYSVFKSKIEGALNGI